MATIRICDLCKQPLDRCMPSNNRNYTLKKWGRIKMEVCGECMEKFLKWANLPSQYNGIPMPPKNGNASQKN